MKDEPEVRQPDRLFARLTEIGLPFERASVKVTDEITVGSALEVELEECPAAAADGSDKCPVSSLARRLLAREARVSPCAQRLTITLADVILDNLNDCESQASEDDGINDGKLRKCLKGRIEAAYVAFFNPPGGACAEETSFEQNRLFLDVESRFKSVVVGDKPKKVKGEVTYDNAPLERYSLGVVSSVFLSTSGDTRVKVDDGKLAPDSLTGSLSLAVLNIHPRRFDPQAEKMSQAERWSFFAGLAVAPEFGLAAGFRFLPIRNLSINAGYAVLRVDTLGVGDEIGEAPSNEDNPLKDGDRGAWFAGLGYSF